MCPSAKMNSKFLSTERHRMGSNGDLTAVELFAGAGGLLLGTSLAGFRHIAAVERERNCCDTLRLNQAKGYPLVDRDMKIIQGDVREVDWSFVQEDVDLLAGGPPCQPFSLGGRAQGHSDSRDMFPAFTAVLARLRPRAFICENVKGLTRESFHQYYEYILLRLQHRWPREKGRRGNNMLSAFLERIRAPIGRPSGTKWCRRWLMLLILAFRSTGTAS